MGSKRVHWHGSPLRVLRFGDNLDSAMPYILLNKPLDGELLVICHTVVAKCEHSPVAGSHSRRAEGCAWPAESSATRRLSRCLGSWDLQDLCYNVVSLFLSA